MTREEFDKLLCHRIDAVNSIVAAKGEEYAEDKKDRLEHFTYMGRLLGTNEFDSWRGCWIKHYARYFKAVEACMEDPGYIPPADIGDKNVTDMIIYLILGEALLKERRSQQNEVKI